MLKDDWLTDNRLAARRIVQHFGSANWSKGSDRCLLLTLRTQRKSRASNGKTSCLRLKYLARPTSRDTEWWTPLKPVSGGSLQSPPTAYQDSEDVLGAIFNDAGSTDTVDLSSNPYSFLLFPSHHIRPGAQS